MKRFLGALLATASLIAPARADDKDATPILDKAIQAMGGEAVLAKAAASATWKTKGTVTLNGDDNDIATNVTAKGLDHLRDEFSGEFNGTEIKGVRILAGSKGWMAIQDNINDMDEEAVANEKHNLFLELAPITILPLKGKGVKVEVAGEETVDGKPAAKVKATAPDGSTFTLCFDKESGLPVKVVGKAFGWQGEEYSREATYSDYKKMGGIQKATKVVIKRDGDPFITATFSEYKPIYPVPAATFAEPK